VVVSMVSRDGTAARRAAEKDGRRKTVKSNGVTGRGGVATACASASRRGGGQTPLVSLWQQHDMYRGSAAFALIAYQRAMR